MSPMAWLPYPREGGMVKMRCSLQRKNRTEEGGDFKIIIIIIIIKACMNENENRMKE
jgi:hypothetical protein